MSCEVDIISFKHIQKVLRRCVQQLPLHLVEHFHNKWWGLLIDSDRKSCLPLIIGARCVFFGSQLHHTVPEGLLAAAHEDSVVILVDLWLK